MTSTALDHPCFGFRPRRLRSLAAFGVVATAARRRGRHGPPFGPWSGFGAFGGGPGGFPRGPKARRGDVRTAALLLIAEGPLNGYQIMQEIEQRSDGLWKPSSGSVYPALAQLVDEGLIQTQEDGDRRTYVLTDAGRAYLDEHRDEAGAPWEQMTRSVDDDVGSLFREMRRVGMTAGQIGHLGDTNQIAQARRILADARKALYALLVEDENDD